MPETTQLPASGSYVKKHKSAVAFPRFDRILQRFGETVRRFETGRFELVDRSHGVLDISGTLRQMEDL